MAGEATTVARHALRAITRLCLSLCCWLQGVATELTRDAYETHARIALEAADLPEFRQCLARLKHLYRSGVSMIEIAIIAGCCNSVWR